MATNDDNPFADLDSPESNRPPESRRDERTKPGNKSGTRSRAPLWIGIGGVAVLVAIVATIVGLSGRTPVVHPDPKEPPIEPADAAKISVPVKGDPPSTPPEPREPSVPTVVKEPSVPVKSDVALSPLDVPLDLSAFLIDGEMTVPKGTSVGRSFLEDRLELRAANGFGIDISLPEEPLAKTRAEWKFQKARFIRDEPNLVFAEVPRYAEGWHFEFDARVKIGATTYQLRNIGNSTRAEAEWMLRSALSLQQTPAIRAALERLPKMVAALEAVECSVDDKNGMRTLFVHGNKVRDEDLAIVKDLPAIGNLSINGADRITAKGMQHLAGLRGVRSLSLAGKYIADDTVAPLKGLSEVRNVRLSSSPLILHDYHSLSDAGLAFLASMPWLESVEIAANPTWAKSLTITGSGLVHLRGAKGLKEVELSGETIDNTALEHLATLPSIKKLTINRCQFTDAGFLQLKNLKELEEVRLFRVPLRGPGLATIGASPKLKRLSATDCPITEIAGLRGSCVKELDFNDCPITDAGLAPAASLAQLTQLVLKNSEVTDLGLAHLAGGLPAMLDYLDLGGTKITDAGLIHLKDSKKLRVLVLSQTKVTEKGLTTLAGLPNILGRISFDMPKGPMIVTIPPDPKPVLPPIPVDKLPAADPTALIKKYGDAKYDDNDPKKPIVSVNLSFSDVTDEELGHLRELKTLQKLDIHRCKSITDAGLAYLAGLPELRELDLHETSVMGDGLVHLRGLTKLTVLRLPDGAFNEKQVAPLAGLKELSELQVDRFRDREAYLRFVSGFPKLRFIDLEKIELNDDRLELLGKMTALEYSGDMRIEKITDRGAKHLGRMRNLKELDFSGHRLSDDGFVVLSNLTGLEKLTFYETRLTDRGLMGLRELKRLKHLYLGGANITDAGLANLAGLTKLESLGLKATGITDQGLRHLRDLESLEYLNLSVTGVNGSGLQFLEMPSLHRIELDRVRLSEAGVAALMSMASLEEISLIGNRLTDRDVAALAKLPSLKTLDLSDNFALTDKAVDSLLKFPALKSVLLNGTLLSPKAIERLRAKEGLEARFD